MKRLPLHKLLSRRHQCRKSLMRRSRGYQSYQKMQGQLSRHLTRKLRWNLWKCWKVNAESFHLNPGHRRKCHGTTHLSLISKKKRSEKVDRASSIHLKLVRDPNTRIEAIKALSLLVSKWDETRLQIFSTTKIWARPYNTMCKSELS